MKVELITPTGSFFDGEASKLTVQAIDGEIGILENHADMLTALGTGLMSLQKSDGSTFQMELSGGGFLQVSKNEISILAESAASID